LKEYKKNNIVIPICSEMEAQMADMSDIEKLEFRKEGINQKIIIYIAGIDDINTSALESLIKHSYEMLNLINFFTVGGFFIF
jgi:ribosome-binding ATPase YchF (GTP1/OBG family)